jgi:hypothetical protein
MDAIHDELHAYSLERHDAAFIHQHVVDAWAAQHAQDGDKPIRLAFALLGLCLHVEHGYTGKAVQNAHMVMGKTKQVWPRFSLPENRGSMTAADVLAAPPGEARDAAIHRWCDVVWAAFHEVHAEVRRFVDEQRVLEIVCSG